MKKNKLLLLALTVLSSVAVFAQTETSPGLTAEKTEDIIFERVEKEARYPGGQPAWRQYLEKNLNPMVPVDNGAPIGLYTVIAQFIVDKNGQLSQIETFTQHGYGMEAELIRILKKSGQWEPAWQNGKPVKAYRRQPVTFVVEDDDVEVLCEEQYKLFTGTDNELEIRAGKLKAADLSLTTTNGTITPGNDGKFIVRTTAKPGTRVIVRIFNKKKNNIEIAAVSFEVAAAK